MSIQILVLMNNIEYNYEENLEAGHLKSYLTQKGVRANLCYINTDKELIYDSIFDQNAVLYAFALNESNVTAVFKTIEILKNINPQAITCVFDAFANYNCRNILLDNSQVDFIPYGNAYKTIHYVYCETCQGKPLSSLEAENLIFANTLFDKKRYMKNDFTNYIWADRKNLKSRDVIIAHLISSYGCSSRCSFCTMPQIDNSISFRDVDDVFNEILDIYNKYNIRFFHFNDATFEGGGQFGKDRLAHLCEMLISYPIKFGFRCFIRAGSFKNIDDEKYISLLKKSGFNNIFVGIESGSDTDLSQYNKRSTVHNNEWFMDISKKNKLNPFYGFVMINPYSSQETIKDNFNFLLKYKSDQFSHYTNCLQIYSNTLIFEKISNDNLLYSNYDYTQSPFQYNCMDTDINALKNFFEKFFYNDMELKKLNSSYHNFIFLKNYLESIDIIDEKIEDKFANISCQLFDMFGDYFNNLYIKHDMTNCINKRDGFVKDLMLIYSSIEPMKEKLLKLYYKSILRL